MHVISIAKLRDFWTASGHEDSEDPLKKWHKVVSKSGWSTFADLKQTFSTASIVESFVVFNIGGNKYRLVVLVSYPDKKVFVRHIMTHKEYDEEKWKNDPWISAAPRKPPKKPKR